MNTAAAQYTLVNSDVSFSGGVITSYLNSLEKNIIIPDNFNGTPVSSIGDYAFRDKGLISVVIPGSITSIGNGAFSAHELKALIIPNSVTYIGSYAFSANPNPISSLIIGNSVDTIGEGAFEYLEIKNLTLPPSTSFIGTDAFSYGEGSFYLPEHNQGYSHTWLVGGSTFNSGDLITSPSSSYSYILGTKKTIINFNILYNLDGGASTNPTNYTTESDEITLSPATKEGLYFEGWYTEPTFTNEIVRIATGSTGNLELFAKYGKNTCENTQMEEILHTRRGANSIQSVSGLPGGVEAIVAENILSIAGTPDSSGTFNYKITMIGNNTTVAMGTINVTSRPLSRIAPPTVLTCLNTSQILDGSESTSNETTYSWSTIGGNITADQTTNLTTIDQEGSYTLIVTDTTTGCADKSVVVVTKNNTAPIVDLSASLKIIDCNNTKAILSTAENDAQGLVSYEWATSDGSFESPNDQFSVNATSAGSYTLTATSTTTGCSGTENIIVTVNNDSPIVDISQSLAVINCKNPIASLNGTGSQTTATSYQWTTIDGVIEGAIDELIITTSRSGTYSLTVKDTLTGCSNTTDVIVSEEIATTNTIDEVTSCEPFTWIDGNTYTNSNNIATDTLLSILGCDSIVKLDLTIENCGNTPNTSFSQLSGNGPFDSNGNCIDDGYAFSFDIFNGANADQVNRIGDASIYLNENNNGYSSSFVKDTNNNTGALLVETVATENQWQGLELNFYTENGTTFEAGKGLNLQENAMFSVRIKAERSFDLSAILKHRTSPTATDGAEKNGEDWAVIVQQYTDVGNYQILNYMIATHTSNGSLFDISKVTGIYLAMRDSKNSGSTLPGDYFIDWIQVGNGRNQTNVPNSPCETSKIEGCTNQTAANYEPLANVDNGSCVARSFTAGKDIESCDQFIPIHASSNWNEVTNWKTNGSGTFLPSSAQGQNDTIYYKVSKEDLKNRIVLLAAEKDESKDTIKITVEQVLSVFAGANIEQIGKASIQLEAIVRGNNVKGTWSTSGSGSFTPNSNNFNSIYIPSQEDVENAAVILTYETENTICPSKKDNLVAILQGCGISTNFEENENKARFQAVNENPKVIAAYTWDFGDGSFGVGQTTEHLYSSPGTYNVSCSSVMSTGFCLSNKSFEITINEIKEEEKSISGTVQVNGAPLDYGTVAIFYISENGNYELLDEIIIDTESNGTYIFDRLKESVYHILVTPSKESIYYETTLPTFIGGSNLENATFIQTEEIINNADIDIETISKSTNQEWNTGNDSYTATVVFDVDFDKKSGRAPRELFDDPKPVQSAVVLLSDLDGTLLSFTSTDEFGEFKFQDLQKGLYDLEISYIGSTSKINQQIIIDGDEQTVVDDFYLLKRSDDSGDLSEATSIGDEESNLSNPEIYIFPNPSTSGIFTIADQYNKVLKATVYNQIGGKMIIVENTKTINLTAFPSGSYLMKTELINGQSTVFLIQKNR